MEMLAIGSLGAVLLITSLVIIPVVLMLGLFSRNKTRYEALLEARKIISDLEACWHKDPLGGYLRVEELTNRFKFSKEELGSPPWKILFCTIQSAEYRMRKFEEMIETAVEAVHLQLRSCSGRNYVETTVLGIAQKISDAIEQRDACQAVVESMQRDLKKLRQIQESSEELLPLLDELRRTGNITTAPPTRAT